MRLSLFVSNASETRTVATSAIESLVVDWERIGKRSRQAGVDTEVNGASVAELEGVVAATSKSVICRVNCWDAGRTPSEIDSAIGAGARTILLPMVRRPAEVEAFLAAVDGRVEAGILIETVDAVKRAGEIARLPVSPIYVGFNDLAIDRGSRNLFEPLADGTVDRLAELFSGRQFGFGGLTVLEKGQPIPCRLLLAEMARTGANFTFLRRSFKRDIDGRNPRVEVERLLRALDRAHGRSAAEVGRDRRELYAAIRSVRGSRTLLPAGTEASAAAG